MSTVKAIGWFIAAIILAALVQLTAMFLLGIFLLLIGYTPLRHLFGPSTFFYLGLLVIVPLSILYTIPVMRLLKQQQRYSASAMSGYIIGVVFVTVLTVYLFVQVMNFFTLVDGL